MTTAETEQSIAPAGSESDELATHCSLLPHVVDAFAHDVLQPSQTPRRTRDDRTFRVVEQRFAAVGA